MSKQKACTYSVYAVLLVNLIYENVLGQKDKPNNYDSFKKIRLKHLGSKYFLVRHRSELRSVLDGVEDVWAPRAHFA